MTTIYIDTSVAVKRALPETAARTLARAFVDRGAEGAVLVTSALTRVEVSRALRRRSAELELGIDEGFGRALQGVAVAPIMDVVTELARTVGPPSLRSLDAIHLATAIALGVNELWTYDVRLGDAAAETGIAVRTPA